MKNGIISNEDKSMFVFIFTGTMQSIDILFERTVQIDE